MLVLVLVFLLSLAVSLIVVWTYRLLIGWYFYAQSQINTPRSVSWMKLATLEGFASFLSAPKEQVKVARLRRSNDDIKAPWGW